MMSVKNTIKLLELSIPGILVGKEVIDKNSARVGVCSGVILDIERKALFLLVVGKNYLLKIPFTKVLDIDEKFIKVDVKVAYENVSSGDINNILTLLRLEILLLAKMMSLNTGRKLRNINVLGAIDMARLFNLV